jgi:diadenosine tetraphosphate (Ap4A) HIT family hydrolase
MAYDDQNIFAKIIRKEIPCNAVFENDHVLAFNDIAPKAPVHILVIPKQAYISFNDFGQNASSDEQHAFFQAVSRIAREHGLDKTGYRMIANHGKDSGQEVDHFHVHILGGCPLGPMLQI